MSPKIYFSIFFTNLNKMETLIPPPTSDKRVKKHLSKVRLKKRQRKREGKQRTTIKKIKSFTISILAFRVLVGEKKP